MPYERNNRDNVLGTLNQAIMGRNINRAGSTWSNILTPLIDGHNKGKNDKVGLGGRIAAGAAALQILPDMGINGADGVIDTGRGIVGRIGGLFGGGTEGTAVRQYEGYGPGEQFHNGNPFTPGINPGARHPLDGAPAYGAPRQLYPQNNPYGRYVPQSFDGQEADVRAYDAVLTSPRNGAPSIPHYAQEYNSASIVEHQFAAALNTESTWLGMGDDQYTGRYKDAHLPISAETVAQIRDNVADMNPIEREDLARRMNGIFQQSGLRVQLTSASEEQVTAGLAAFAASSSNPRILSRIEEGLKQTTLSGSEQRPMFHALVNSVYEASDLVGALSQMQTQQAAVRRNGAPTPLIPDQPAAGRGSDGVLARGDLSSTGEKVGGMDVDDLQAKLAEAGLGDMLGSTGVDGNYGRRTEATVKYAAALMEQAGVGYSGNVDMTGQADEKFIEALKENLPKVKQQADHQRS